MTSDSNVETVRVPRGWIPAPGEPHDRCAKCGRPTPIGTSLCADDNPGNIGAPSATQAHGTIFLGVVAGFAALALAASAALGTAGPFTGAIESAVTRSDGGVDVSIRVTNQGTNAAPANCRVSRGGVAESDDLVFLTDRLAPAETRSFVRTIPARTGSQRPIAIDRLTVTCR